LTRELKQPSMSRPLVSIVIVNRNGKQYLDKCINSILSQTYKDYEIILVDNASTDGSAEYIKTKYPNVHVIENKVNLMFCKANNLGAKIAKGKYLFFLNNDAYLKPDALEKLVLSCENLNLIAATPKIVRWDGTEENAGLSCDIFCNPLLIPPNKCDDKYFYIEGCAFFIRRDIFLKMLFDEDFLMYKEDVDLCWRLRLCGFKLGRVPDAVVYHKGGGTSRMGIEDGGLGYLINPLTRYLSERNTLQTILKNYGLLNLIWIIQLYFILIIIESLFLLLIMREKIVPYLYISAILWNLRNLNKILKKRVVIQKIRKVRDKEIMKRMQKKFGKLKVLKYHRFNIKLLKVT